MLTLINLNRMQPPIAPIGLDYVATAVRQQGLEVDVLDLGLVDDPQATLAAYFAHEQPELIGITLRNIDDGFWPSGAWFLPALREAIQELRTLSAAPIVLGGVGFSMFAEPILRFTGADLGIRGDGETSLTALLHELRGSRRFERVPGLIWPTAEGFRHNAPAWPSSLQVPTSRDAIDNAAYFRRGGQIGIETKRGCPRKCVYCGDPLAKGNTSRLRNPAEVADEFEALLAQGIDVFHLCDSEFNTAEAYATAVCDELIRRRLGERMRWYAYLAVLPFDAELAERMRRAGCAGINFTSDAANAAMLRSYRQPHGKEDMARAVRCCREQGMAVMLDLLLGGPGETPETAAESIAFFQQVDPDCAGATLGVRLHPETEITQRILAEGPLESNPGLRRHYQGPIDLLRPTFYIAPTLGKRPARLIRELIGGDPRFFEPAEEMMDETAAVPRTDYNYNENHPLSEAIRQGARGAYWDILRRLRR